MEQETPEAPRLGRLLEDTLTVPFTAPSLFTRLSQCPAPGYGLLAANTAAYYALAIAVNLVRSLLDGGSALSPAVMAAAAAGAAAIAVALSFAGAGLLHALCLLAGGTGDFRRSYQLVSSLSFLFVIQSLLNWSPLLWALPVPWAALLLAEGCRRLHAAPRARAWAVFGGLGLLLLGSQWLARREFSRFLQQTEVISPAAAQLQQAAAGLQALQQALPLLPGATEALAVGPALAAPGRLPSSLDLLSGPGVMPLGTEDERAPGPAPKMAPPANPAQLQALQSQAALTMDALLPMLNNPAVTRMLTPEQRAQMDAIAKMLQAAQAQQKTGKPLTPQERAQRRADAEKMQAMMMKMMENRK